MNQTKEITDLKKKIGGLEEHLNMLVNYVETKLDVKAQEHNLLASAVVSHFDQLEFKYPIVKEIDFELEEFKNRFRGINNPITPEYPIYAVDTKLSETINGCFKIVKIHGILDDYNIDIDKDKKTVSYSPKAYPDNSVTHNVSEGKLRETLTKIREDIRAKRIIV